MIRNLWQLITYHRHRCELRALRAGRKLPFVISPLPIMLVVAALYFLGVLPLILVHFLMLGLGASEFFAIMIISVPALAFLGIVAPWYSRWLSVTFGMQFGNFKKADAKEKELSAALELYESRQAENAAPRRA